MFSLKDPGLTATARASGTIFSKQGTMLNFQGG